MLDRSFGALSDPTRRAILLRLGPRRRVHPRAASYQQRLEQRLDSLDGFLERTRGTP